MYCRKAFYITKFTLGYQSGERKVVVIDLVLVFLVQDIQEIRQPKVVHAGGFVIIRHIDDNVVAIGRRFLGALTFPFLRTIEEIANGRSRPRRRCFVL